MPVPHFGGPPDLTPIRPQCSSPARVSKVSVCVCKDGTVTVHEPVDLLLTCVRQVLLLAQPRNKQTIDSIDGRAEGGTTPSILRPAAEASQEGNPNQVSCTQSSSAVLPGVLAPAPPPRPAFR